MTPHLMKYSSLWHSIKINWRHYKIRLPSFYLNFFLCNLISLFPLFSAVIIYLSFIFIDPRKNRKVVWHFRIFHSIMILCCVELIYIFETIWEKMRNMLWWFFWIKIQIFCDSFVIIMLIFRAFEPLSSV